MIVAREQAGFTLIEVLVAFAILSMTMIVGLKIFSDGMSRIARVESRLAELNAEKRSLLEGRLEGQEDRGVWNQKIQLPAEAAPWTLLKPVLVRAGVEAGADELSLETIQLKSEP